MRRPRLVFLRALWRLVGPYWSSDDKWAGRGLLAAVIGLNLGLIAINVRFNTWNNDFYNAVQEFNENEFYKQIAIFTGLALVFVLVSVYQLYLNQMLQIRWRRWLTRKYLGAWLGEQRFYRLQVSNGEADNPDQRIGEDINLFVEKTLTLGLGFMNSVVTLISFVTILWALSGILKIPLPGGGTLIEDCYNANPPAMAAALADLCGREGRHVAVLADMLELGPDELAFHRGVGEDAARMGVDLLIAVGTRAAAYPEGADGVQAVTFPDTDAAVAGVPALIEPGDVVLVKGSRGMAMERVARAIAGGS